MVWIGSQLPFIMIISSIYIISAKVAASLEQHQPNDRSVISPIIRPLTTVGQTRSEESPISIKKFLWQTSLVALVFTTILFCLIHIVKNVPFRPIIALSAWVVTYQTLKNIARKMFDKLIWRISGCLSALLVTLAWFYAPNWITISIAASILSMNFLIQLWFSSLNKISYLAAGIIIFDLIAVFWTKWMVDYANLLKTYPVYIAVPSLTIDGQTVLSSIGLGDIILPGAVIMLAFRQARQLEKIFLGYGTLLGFIVGLCVSSIILHLTQLPQPATLYLFPSVYLGLICSAYFTNSKVKFESYD